MLHSIRILISQNCFSFHISIQVCGVPWKTLGTVKRKGDLPYPPFLRMKRICVMRSYKSTISRRESDVIIKVIYVARFYARLDANVRSSFAVPGPAAPGIIIVRESTLLSALRTANTPITPRS